MVGIVSSRGTGIQNTHNSSLLAPGKIIQCFYHKETPEFNSNSKVVTNCVTENYESQGSLI